MSYSICLKCGQAIYKNQVHNCTGSTSGGAYGFEKTPYSVKDAIDFFRPTYINPCDTCKLWDKCKKYRGCFEEKEIETESYKAYKRSQAYIECRHIKCTRKKLPSGMTLIVCNNCGENFICEEIPG